MPVSSRNIEIACNQFAGAFLVPEDALDRELADSSHGRSAAERIAEKFCVSREVIYRKFLDRKLISRAEYEQAVDGWKQTEKRGDASGGDYYKTQIAYLGLRYVNLAFERFHQNRFDADQLADYLNIKPKSVPGLEAEYFRGIAG